MNRSLLPRFFRLFLVFASSLIVSVVVHAQVPAEPTKPADTATSPSGVTKTPADATESAAEPEQSQSPVANPPANPNKSAETLRLRIERARALIAAHRLDTAASELESVRATAQDNAFRNISSIMLMNVYLEEGNYGRAEALLEENFKARSTQKDESLGSYFALAGQAVNGARTHLARYRTFGISTADSNLPAEAVTDLNRLRSLLERMIAQAKEISSVRGAYDSLSLLEDVLGLRLSLSRDAEDQSKWQSEYASAREALASSQTQIASLGGIPPLRPGKSTGNTSAAPSPYSTKRPSDTALETKAADKDHVSTATQPSVENQGSDVSEAGSLNAFATKKVVPKYPLIAKQTGTTGLVRVHVIVEGGKVIAVSRSEGPTLLRQAAEDAARQWSFQSVSIEGRPTRLSGYIEFNFSL
ncbi:MAG TPA: energy transducer TonB [Pyrinomonadaceae bacterium]|nr:energy transducer TonB [Pyrinomonadaceae bacterium]